MNTVGLEQKIGTNFFGYKRLIQFYKDCSVFKDEIIFIDFSHLDFIEANLCALFSAIIYKLSKENKLGFTADLSLVQKNFEVLIRNGFIKGVENIPDKQKSTLPAMNFSIDDKHAFVDYIETHLMQHRGIPKGLTEVLKDQITDDLIEIFFNSHHHAQTMDPFFVAGQYFPIQGYLRITMVDLGQGFLPRINKATNGEIDTSLKAIEWALKGNSSRILDGTPGGLGLSSILKYCKSHKGELDIISGDAYWSSTYENTIFEGGKLLDSMAFVGTTINLSFKN